MAGIEKRSRNDLARWRVVWREDGEKQQQTFKIEDAATKFKARVEAYGNHWPPGEDPRVRPVAPTVTFGEWAEKAINQRTRANERTKADYRRDLDRHMSTLLPLALDQIGDAEVATWVDGLRGLDELGERKLSEKTVRNLHGFASSVYVDALAQHPPLVTHNPFARRLGAAADVHVEEMVFLTAPEFALVLGHVRDEYAPLVRFLAGTGARFGEATALRVADVDLFGRRKTVTITKAWKRTGPATWKVGEPKTPRSRRTLSLSAELVELLIPLVSARKGTELLFAGRDGGRLPHSEVWKRGWAPAVARARVCETCWQPQRSKRNKDERPRLPAACAHDGVLTKVPRIHDLRHSHASWLIADSVPLAAISRRPGHSSITITVDRYGHLDPSLDDQINASVDRALRGAPDDLPIS